MVEEYSRQQMYTYLTGEVIAWGQAATVVAEKATRAFLDRDDDRASLLRDVSEELRGMADAKREERKNHEVPT